MSATDPTATRVRERPSAVRRSCPPWRRRRGWLFSEGRGTPRALRVGGEEGGREGGSGVSFDRALLSPLSRQAAGGLVSRPPRRELARRRAACRHLEGDRRLAQQRLDQAHRELDRVEALVEHLPSHRIGIAPPRSRRRRRVPHRGRARAPSRGARERTRARAATDRVFVRGETSSRRDRCTTYAPCAVRASERGRPPQPQPRGRQPRRVDDSGVACQTHI